MIITTKKKKKKAIPTFLNHWDSTKKCRYSLKCPILALFFLVLCKAMQRVWQQVYLTYTIGFKTAGIGPGSFETLFQHFFFFLKFFRVLRHFSSAISRPILALFQNENHPYRVFREIEIHPIPAVLNRCNTYCLCLHS